MRVLHIDTGTAMRGGQWQVLHVVQGLTLRGIHSRLLAPSGSPLLAAAMSAGCDAHALNLFSTVRQASAFDLLHAHDARAHTLALPASKPLVVSRRVGFPVKRTLMSQYKYSRPRHFIVVSQYVRSVLADAGIPPRKISVVYDGVQLPDLSQAGNRSSIVALDSDDPGKGKAIIERASQLAGLPAHFSRSLSQDLPRAALFVYISEMEGLGSAALLAMAHGVPVLASRIGGLPEIVEHGRTGMLTSNDPEQIAASMKQLIDDPVLRARMAQQGRAVVEQRFTVAHMVENTLATYERVLS